jgi:hypothetical protein
MFYPKENFHWKGASTHLFSKTFFQSLNLDVSKYGFSDGATVEETFADLQSIGFKRRIKVWSYPYKSFKVSENQQSKFGYLRRYYERMYDFSYYTSSNPLQDKDAVLISNSFGAFIARDLAPGYKSLLHINVNNLQRKDQKELFDHLFTLGKNMDFIFLYHDAALAGRNGLVKLSNGFN